MAYPHTLAWSGYWSTNYAGSPWVGEATAGASSGRDLTEATNPPATGTARYGHTPADFDGVNDTLSSVNLVEDFMTDWVTVHAVVKVNSAVAPSAFLYDDPCIINVYASAAICISVTTSGVAFQVYTSTGSVQTGYVPLSLGVVHCVQARSDGTNCSIRVDGGAWTSVANVDPIVTAPGVPLLVGKDYYASNFLDADIYTLGVAPSAFSDGTLDSLYAYDRDRYIFLPLDATLAGDASLTASLDLLGGAIAVDATISGDGSVTSSLSLLGALDSGLTGDASVTSSLDLLGALTTALAGDGSVTSSLDLLGALDTALTGDAAVTASLDVLGSGMDATLAGDASVTSSLSLLGALGATLAGDASVAASLDVNLVAALAGDASVASSLSLLGALSSTVSGDASVSSALSVVSPLASALAGGATVTASLVTSGVAVPVDATLAGGATVAASLVLQGSLSATLAGGTTIGLLSLTTISSDFDEYLTIVEDASFLTRSSVAVEDTLTLFEAIRTGLSLFESQSNTTIQVVFPEELRLNGVSDVTNYSVDSYGGGFPINILSVAPIVQTKKSGVQGQVVESAPGVLYSRVFDLYSDTAIPSDIGGYLVLGSESFQITAVAGSQVTVDRPIPIYGLNGNYVPGSGFTSGTGQLVWSITTGVLGATLTVTEGTDGASYLGRVTHLQRAVSGQIYSSPSSFSFQAIGLKPRVSSVQLSTEGTLLITFNEDMRIDAALLDVAEYSITGPTRVQIESVSMISSRSIALLTSGFGAGSYNLTVNATGTPKDLAGNPIDPIFNLAAFSGSVPVTSKSIFTDKGPIVRPALTLQSGVNGTIQTFTTTTFGASKVFTSNEVVLPGGVFTSSHVGLQLELGNSTVNGGTYKVLGVVAANRLKLQANLRLPDSNNGSLSWKLVNPRTGEIADDPSDVSVRVNGVAVTPLAVVGLLGQVVLPSVPASTDTVKIDYSWISEPTVEFRRLNSKEFRLNACGNNVGTASGTQHSYRYRNTTVQPAKFVPTVTTASLVQPLFRELHYRAFERAYSVALNDPNLLTLNCPTHKIAYAPLSREIVQTTVNYSADTLPEADSDPWVRKGSGTATVTAGSLVIQDTTEGGFPSGNPLFWVKDVDLTYPHVFAATWRMQVNSFTSNGVFTGVGIGWSGGRTAIVLGYIYDGGTRKLGFLKRGFGNDPSGITAWFGGVTTNLPVNFDWSTNHSYRLFRSRDGVVQLFVDGEVIPSLQVAEADLPFLEELNDPFVQLQGVFFGSLSREAKNSSSWDFVRYLSQPTNPSQTAPSIFAGYEGDLLPEVTATPWTPVGYHGNETLLATGSLLLDSTSATTQSTSTSVGLIGGDFKGFTRIEPLLSVSSNVVLDVNVQLRTLTHGITPNALMAALDDGNRLIQLCLFPYQSQPKVSYPGRSLPQEASPPWAALGTATGSMVGRTLRVTDTLTTGGLVYFREDLEAVSSPSRIIEASIDSTAEFKVKVVSFTPDGTSIGFCGATVDIFDGTRAVGLMLRQTTLGVFQVAFHSDGSLLGVGSQFLFNWNDGLSHIYRVVKSATGNLVSLFIDNNLIGSFPYTSFNVGLGNPTMSFGSATGSSVSSTSVVDWVYVNIWRGQSATPTRYAGIWKGSDSDSLTGYHLPLKLESKSGIVAGNTLTDTTVDFVAASVSVGNHLVIDIGPDKGTYTVASVGTNTLTFVESFAQVTEMVGYRIPLQVDWTLAHKYRIVRDPDGFVAVLLDATTTPLIRVDYSSVTLPPSSVGVPYIINRGLPSVSWGCFDPTNLSQSAWDYVRYGITSSPTETRIAPHHQVLNQRNVMASPEHLTTTVAHGHTQYSSSSTGIPHPWKDFTDNALNIAFTRLNEGTPLMPSTQTYEVRRPTPVFEFVSGLNRPEDVLNSDPDFVLNDASQRSRLIVPNDVLYDGLQITEETTGEAEHLYPYSDGNITALGKLNWTKEVCGTYLADVLPELDPNFGTTWVLQSDNPGATTTTVSSGVLTYSTTATPNNNTIYRNATPLTDSVGLQTRVDFKIKVVADSSLGLGDSGIRFGFNALGLTASLAFVTTPLGDREVRLLDLNTNLVLGAIPFDFLDGLFHVYRLEKNPVTSMLDVSIDP